MLQPRTYHVYIVTGLSLHRVLYVGVTSNLPARIYAHRRSAVDGFTARYRLWKLVYAEAFTYVRDAIAREKQIKGMEARAQGGAHRLGQPQLDGAPSGRLQAYVASGVLRPLRGLRMTAGGGRFPAVELDQLSDELSRPTP